MGRALAKSRKQGKRKRGALEFPPGTGVSGGFRPGKRKRGNSLLKVSPRESASANTTASDIATALEIAPNALAHLNGRGVVKLLTYSRD